ncbi:MAG: amidohydrolase family protein [Candidatus Firestonebacteria bacterium]
MKTAIINGNICTPYGIKHNAVLIIEDEHIKEIQNSNSRSRVKADKVIDAKNNYVLPGFFDTHCHGGGLFDTSSGKYILKNKKFSAKENDYESGIFDALKIHAGFGTTSMFLTASAMPEMNMHNFTKYGGDYTKKHIPGSTKLLGLDLEGVFLKNPKYAGAQSPEFFKKPDIKYFNKLTILSNNTIKKVLVAPEWGKAGYDLIKYLTKNKIVSCVGHSGATYDEVMKAYDLGTKVVVHCGNGPMSQNFKGGGVIDALFYLQDKVWAELICDYCHIHPRWLVSFIKNFRFNIIGITDAMFVVGFLEKIKEFKMGSKTGIVNNGVLKVKDSSNTLFGSCLTMDKAFENFLNLFISNQWGYLVGNLFDKDLSFDKAIIEASKLLSCYPAQVYGFDKSIGSIEPDKSADIVIMNIKKDKKYICKIKTVIINGFQIMLEG